MRTIHLLKTITKLSVILIASTLFSSCDIGDFGSADLNTLFPINYSNSTLASVKLHRVNNYPANATMEVRSYSAYGNNSFSPGTAFVFRMPVSDSTVLFSASLNSYQYFTWKISNSNKDSIAGGKTSVITLPGQNYMEVNY